MITDDLFWTGFYVILAEYNFFVPIFFTKYIIVINGISKVLYSSRGSKKRKRVNSGDIYMFKIHLHMLLNEKCQSDSKKPNVVLK